MTSADTRHTGDSTGADGPPAANPPDDGDAGGGGAGGGRGPGGRPRWARGLIAACLATALVLLGATGGLLLGQPGDAPATPDLESVDVGFAQDMSVHHGNAVQMAVGTRDRSTDPAIRQLAYDIESGQTAQIGQMQGWLSLWNAPARSTSGYMRWMPDMVTDMGIGHASDGLAAMPGMASAEDLARLRNSTGPAGDVLFLQLMLRHHEGGAAMLRHAADNAELPQVRNLAAQMLTAQTAESQAIRQLLTERGAAPLGG